MAKERKMIGENRIVGTAEVMDRTGLSRSTIWRLRRLGEFPSAYRIGQRHIGWHAADLDEWFASHREAAA